MSSNLGSTDIKDLSDTTAYATKAQITLSHQPDNKTPQESTHLNHGMVAKPFPNASPMPTSLRSRTPLSMDNLPEPSSTDRILIVNRNEVFMLNESELASFKVSNRISEENFPKLSMFYMQYSRETITCVLKDQQKPFQNNSLSELSKLSPLDQDSVDKHLAIVHANIQQVIDNAPQKLFAIEVLRSDEVETIKEPGTVRGTVGITEKPTGNRYLSLRFWRGSPADNIWTSDKFFLDLSNSRNPRIDWVGFFSSYDLIFQQNFGWSNIYLCGSVLRLGNMKPYWRHLVFQEFVNLGVMTREQADYLITCIPLEMPKVEWDLYEQLWKSLGDFQASIRGENKQVTETLFATILQIATKLQEMSIEKGKRLNQTKRMIEIDNQMRPIYFMDSTVILELTKKLRDISLQHATTLWLALSKMVVDIEYYPQIQDAFKLISESLYKRDPKLISDQEFDLYYSLMVEYDVLSETETDNNLNFLDHFVGFDPKDPQSFTQIFKSFSEQFPTENAGDEAKEQEEPEIDSKTGTERFKVLEAHLKGLFSARCHKICELLQKQKIEIKQTGEVVKYLASLNVNCDPLLLPKVCNPQTFDECSMVQNKKELSPNNINIMLSSLAKIIRVQNQLIHRLEPNPPLVPDFRRGVAAASGARAPTHDAATAQPQRSLTLRDI